MSKILTSINYSLGLFVLCFPFFISCNEEAKSSSEKTKKNHLYKIIVSLNKDSQEYNDTIGSLEKSDSAGFLFGKVKFGRYLTDWEMIKYSPQPKPISFVVVDEKGYNIKNNLTESALIAIDSIAKFKIEKERNAIYEKSGNIRIIDSEQKENGY